MTVVVQLGAVNLLPQVFEYETNTKNFFLLHNNTKIEVVEEGLVEIAQDFARRINVSLGIDILAPRRAKHRIQLFVDEELGSEESYFIRVGKKKIEVYGGGYAGVYYAMQTLYQLLPFEPTEEGGNEYALPLMAVSDAPYNEKRELNMFLECEAESFVDSMKTVIDMASNMKINAITLYTTQTINSVCVDIIDELTEYAKRKFVKVGYVFGELDASVIRYKGNISEMYGEMAEEAEKLWVHADMLDEDGLEERKMEFLKRMDK